MINERTEMCLGTRKISVKKTQWKGIKMRFDTIYSLDRTRTLISSLCVVLWRCQHVHWLLFTVLLRVQPQSMQMASGWRRGLEVPPPGLPSVPNSTNLWQKSGWSIAVNKSYSRPILFINLFININHMRKVGGGATVPSLLPLGAPVLTQMQMTSSAQDGGARINRIWLL